MMEKYNIIVKTAEAEIRALENVSSEHITQLFPIIELTRGRKVTRNNVATYPFEKRLEKLKKIFKDQDICIDVTSDPQLASPETKALFNPKNGYENWIKFLIRLKDEGVFRSITPTILWNFEDNEDDFEENIKAQISALTNEFGMVAYRNSIEEDSGFYDDLETFLSDTPLIFILDCEYVPRASFRNVAERCIVRFNHLNKILTNKQNKYILTSTSFPNNVTEFGVHERELLTLSEIDLFNTVKAKHPYILYGDYGSINPTRNDTITMSRGWVPRIDVSLPTEVLYHRQKKPKGVTAYADTYIQVAKSCLADEKYPQNIKDSWGLRQIVLCAAGSVPSSSPSFWISVRMNTHIMQRFQANSNLFQ